MGVIFHIFFFFFINALRSRRKIFESSREFIYISESEFYFVDLIDHVVLEDNLVGCGSKKACRV